MRGVPMLASVAVSTAAWLLGDWIFGMLFPEDEVKAFFATWMFVLVAGGGTMLWLIGRGRARRARSRRRW